MEKVYEAELKHALSISEKKNDVSVKRLPVQKSQTLAARQKKNSTRMSGLHPGLVESTSSITIVAATAIVRRRQ